VKVAICATDHVFRSAEDLAARRPVSRSKLYSNALAEFIEKQENDLITSHRNEVYAKKRKASALAPEIALLQFHTIKRHTCTCGQASGGGASLAKLSALFRQTYTNMTIMSTGMCTGMYSPPHPGKVQITQETAHAEGLISVSEFTMRRGGILAPNAGRLRSMARRLTRKASVNSHSNLTAAKVDGGKN